jgi:hypothetical protein
MLHEEPIALEVLLRVFCPTCRSFFSIARMPFALSLSFVLLTTTCSHERPSAALGLWCRERTSDLQPLRRAFAHFALLLHWPVHWHVRIRQKRVRLERLARSFLRSLCGLPAKQ